MSKSQNRKTHIYSAPNTAAQTDAKPAEAAAQEPVAVDSQTEDTPVVEQQAEQPVEVSAEQSMSPGEEGEKDEPKDVAPEPEVTEPVVVKEIPAQQAPAVVVAAPGTEAPVKIEPTNPFKTPQARLAYEELHDYVRTLSQKKTPSSDDGAALQAGLHRALLGAINAPAEEFTAVMDHFLAVVYKHEDGIFSERQKFRWMPALRMTPAAIDNFRKLVTMFTAVANPRSRVLAVKQIDWHSTLQYSRIKEDSLQRVMAYFGI